MSDKNKKKRSALIANGEPVAQNKKARYDYHIGETLEAGLQLTGTEVKSLRAGQCSIAESYIDIRENEAFLVNATINEYGPAGAHLQHNPTRVRKILLHKREINKLRGAIQREGMTVVATKLYFNKFGKAKLEIGMAKGKKQHDKRQTEKQRDWNRDKARLLKNNV